jgi:subtilase family serine protease
MYFARPAWQRGNGVPAGAQRLVPDVSAPADPNEGAVLILHGQRRGIGGTSYPLLGTNCFRDIISGYPAATAPITLVPATIWSPASVRRT